MEREEVQGEVEEEREVEGRKTSRSKQRREVRRRKMSRGGQEGARREKGRERRGGYNIRCGLQRSPDLTSYSSTGQNVLAR